MVAPATNFGNIKLIFVIKASKQCQIIYFFELPCLLTLLTSMLLGGGGRGGGGHGGGNYNYGNHNQADNKRYRY